MNRATNNMNAMVLTPQVYNLLMVSVAMCFIVYCVRSGERFYRTLKLRAAVLSNKLIEIKGVGENLIFLEDCAYPHAMGVIHNRQAEPSREVDCCYIPFKVNFVKVLPDDGSYVISVWNSVPCHIYLLINVNIPMLKGADFARLLANVNTKPSSSVLFSAGSGSASTWVNTVFNPFCQAVTSPVLVEANVEFSNVIRLLPMIGGSGGGSGGGGSSSSGGNGGGGNGENMRTVMPGGAVVVGNYAVLVVPLASKGKGAAGGGVSVPELKVYTTSTDILPSRTPGVDTSAGGRTVYNTTDQSNTLKVVDSDVEMGAMNTNVDAGGRDETPILQAAFAPLSDSEGSSGMHSNSNQLSQLSTGSSLHSPDGGNTTRTVATVPLSKTLSFGLHVFTPSQPSQQPADGGGGDNSNGAQAAADGGDSNNNSASKPSGYVAETDFYCVNNDFFASAEVFGSTPTFNNLPPGGNNGGGGDGDDGGIGDDDCVICLTDPKEVLLLPCRHLCVCKSCFHQIDRCPICRNNFDKYLMLSADETAIIDISSGRHTSTSRAKVVRRRVLTIPPYTDDASSAKSVSDAGGLAVAGSKSTPIYNEVHVD